MLAILCSRCGGTVQGSPRLVGEHSAPRVMCTDCVLDEWRGIHPDAQSKVSMTVASWALAFATLVVILAVAAWGAGR